MGIAAADRPCPIKDTPLVTSKSFSSRPDILRRALPLLPVMAALALGACAKDNDIDLTSGVGILASRSLCPSVGVPTYTGDVTLFDPATSRDSTAIDVVATITDVRTTCSGDEPRVYAGSTFTVQARRRDTAAARDVTLPYYAAVVQGGTSVVAKDQSQVVLHFPAGAATASTTATAGAYVDRAAITLPQDIRDQITRRRRAGDADAAIDPLSLPDVRAAVTRASFELLIGFQLTQDQLQYNVTR